MEYNNKLQGYTNSYNALKNKAGSDFEKAKNAFNRNDITDQDYNQIVHSYVHSANEAIDEIRQGREVELQNINQSFHHELTRTSRPDRFREHYEKLQGQDRDAISKHYHNSLKLDDDVGLQAAACVALEKAQTDLIQDYMQRNLDWANTLRERKEFHEKYMSPEGKMRASMEFSHLHPPRVKKQRVEDGYLANGQKVYRDKLV